MNLKKIIYVIVFLIMTIFIANKKSYMIVSSSISNFVNSNIRMKTNMKERDCELFNDSIGYCNNICNIITCEDISRDDFLKPIKTNPNLKILEIGPYNFPALQGQNVKYFDIMTSEELRNRAANEKLSEDVIKVPNKIDYVSRNGDMTIIKDKFDIVFSSHNIEHQIDLVNHLNQVADILTNNGKFYLFIPDKRYCFDHYIPESSLSDIIAEHYRTEKQDHPLRTILAMECETTHNNTKHHWRNNSGEVSGKDYKCYQKALNKYNEAQGKYIDAHRWRFTPQQFKFIIEELNKLGLIRFKIEKIYKTQSFHNEFKVILTLQN